MSEDLSKLFEQGQPVSQDELAALFEKSAPHKAEEPSVVGKIASGTGRVLRSALRGAEQGLTLGFGDELDAGVEALKRKYLPNALGGDSAASIRSLPDVYRQARDEFRRDDQAVRAEHPAIFTAGQIGGGMLLPVPGATAATALGRIGQTAATGAGIGAANALGNSDELNGQALDETARGALLGGGIGAAAGVAGEGIRKGAPVLSRALRKFAERRAVKAAGAIKSDIGAMRPEQIQSLGGYALDNGLVHAGDNAEQVLQRVNAARENQGQQIGELLEAADSLGGGQAFNATRFASRVRNGLLKDVRSNPALQAVAEEPILNLLSKVEGDGGQRMMSLPKANEFESALSKGLYSKLDPAPKIEQMQRLRDVLNEEINAQVARISPGISEHLSNADANYGPLAQLSKIGDKAIQREVGNRFFSPSDHAVGIGGAIAMAASGHPLGAALALGGSAANKLLRERGPSTMAAGANRLSRALLSQNIAPAIATAADKNAGFLASLLRSQDEQGRASLIPSFAESDEDIRRKGQLAALRGDK